MELYKLLKDSDINPLAKVGTIVFKMGYDYGLASDDTRMTGIEHISVAMPGEGGRYWREERAKRACFRLNKAPTHPSPEVIAAMDMEE